MQTNFNHYRLAAIILCLCIPALGLAQETPTDEQQEVEPDSAATEEEPVEIAEQVVTGSRLEGGDPTARIYSYTAEEIAARGVSTLEEFFRTLPWTYPSITTQTNTSLHFDGTDQDEEYIELGLGISTVNLRNMGSANTLVLMNGRRIAGTGEEDDFANILNVPLSAIERVDIQLDGASAVYGSDAIGGVVNFITKKNYTGLSVDYRHEFSSTDADQTTASLIGGHAWGSGNVTAIVSRETSEPITNAKTGLTTRDFRPRLGPEFDLRSFTTGQPRRRLRIRSTLVGAHLVPLRAQRTPVSTAGEPQRRGHDGGGLRPVRARRGITDPLRSTPTAERRGVDHRLVHRQRRAIPDGKPAGLCRPGLLEARLVPGVQPADPGPSRRSLHQCPQPLRPAHAGGLHRGQGIRKRRAARALHRSG